jgi:hypothetical protein
MGALGAKGAILGTASGSCVQDRAEMNVVSERFRADPACIGDEIPDVFLREGKQFGSLVQGRSLCRGAFSSQMGVLHPTCSSWSPGVTARGLYARDDLCCQLSALLWVDNCGRRGPNPVPSMRSPSPRFGRFLFFRSPVGYYLEAEPGVCVNRLVSSVEQPGAGRAPFHLDFSFETRRRKGWTRVW